MLGLMMDRPLLISTLIEFADLVTEMRLVKHPFRDQGIAAQRGIEF